MVFQSATDAVIWKRGFPVLLASSQRLAAAIEGSFLALDKIVIGLSANQEHY